LRRFVGRRKRADNVDKRPPQKDFVGAGQSRRDGKLLPAIEDNLVDSAVSRQTRTALKWINSSNTLIILYKNPNPRIP
jgi:hypothetical protein